MNPSGYIDFITNVIDGASPLSVTFKSLILTTLKPISYLWEFGDGTRSTYISPTHVYTIGGDITPTLTVTFEDNSQSILSKQNFLRIFKVQVIPTDTKGLAPFTTELDTYSDLPRNVTITSYTWSFGDTYSSTGINPVHTYINPGIYSGSLLNGFTGLGFSGVQSYPFSSSFNITAITPSIKYSDMFTCLGWIRNPITADQTSLIPLAVADQYNNVINTSLSIKFEIFRDGNDYRLLYSGAKSKLIGKTIKIALNDGSWHCLGYECDSAGNILFYIDDAIVPAEDGKGPDGIAYNKARSVNSRLGGGPVWAPYLYALNQSIELYNWRYGKDFNLGQNWINQLINVDEIYLNS
jgi:hypothetical protein